MGKIEMALFTCEKVLSGIEDNTSTTLAALLQCLKIARLLNDQNAIVWLQYEYGGYPRDDDGIHIRADAWNVAYHNGRGYTKDGNKLIFVETASELEETILAEQKAVNNFSMNGIALSGDVSYRNIDKLTSEVKQSNRNAVSNMVFCKKKLSILKSKYYDYALKKQIEVSFGNVVTTIFDNYKEQVECQISTLSKKTILQLQAMEDKINSDNPELYSQALMTCRRLFENVAQELFDKYFCDYEGNSFKTKSGKEIDISGEHFKNKMIAVIDKLENKSCAQSIVGSSFIYLLDWIDNIIDLQCKGVHRNIVKQDAIRCIIQTYICVGDILNLQH